MVAARNSRALRTITFPSVVYRYLAKSAKIAKEEGEMMQCLFGYYLGVLGVLAREDFGSGRRPGIRLSAVSDLIAPWFGI
jgi:hypothetical protein